MKVMNIQPSISPIEVNGKKRTEDKSSFGSILNQYINDANAAVKASENQSLRLAKGEAVDLHDVTIAAQKASVALQLTVQLRDKAVEAYQEMMRTQV